MMFSRTLVVVLALLAFSYTTFGHRACDYRSRYIRKAKTDEACSARCKKYNEEGTTCFGWYRYLFGGCYVYLLDTEPTYSSYAECGVNSAVDVNVENVVDVEAEAPDSEPVGCRIATGVDIGHADSKEACEKLCTTPISSNRYRACLAWFWDEEDSECDGAMIQDDTYYSCGI